MTTITADQQTALARFAQSAVALSESFGVDLPGKPAAAKKKRAKRYGPVDASTPPAVRAERQRLILAEIDAAGGAVNRADWLGIAGRYGYDSRRLGGFFAKNGGAGMLEMSADRKMVQLTAYGRERI